MQKRWYWWSATLAIVGAVAAGAAWTGHAAPSAAEPSSNPKSVVVEKCLVVLIDKVDLSFERPGILGSIVVREGDEVKEGQLLATLKDDVAKATLAVAQAEAESDVEIRFAQKSGDLALVEHEKMQAANREKPKTVPDLEVKKAYLAYEKTVLEAEKATHSRKVHTLKRDEAQVQLDTYRILAPFEGFVTRVHLSKGGTVRQGDPVIELVSTKKVKVEGQVKVGDLATVRPGSKVSVKLDVAEAGSGAASRVFLGKIVFVDVKSIPVGHKIRVWAEVDNVDNALRSGLDATMTILPPSND